MSNQLPEGWEWAAPNEPQQPGEAEPVVTPGSTEGALPTRAQLKRNILGDVRRQYGPDAWVLFEEQPLPDGMYLVKWDPVLRYGVTAERFCPN
jgi:hypothetical protein